MAVVRRPEGDGAPQQRFFRGHDAQITAIAVHPDGRTIATAEWLHAHDQEHNRNGKQVTDVATRRDHEVAIPITIEAL